MNSNFWQKPFRMIQLNLRKIDAVNMDVKELVDKMDEVGGNVILANAGGIVSWYPTEIPYQHKNEFLKIDYVHDIIKEAHLRGMKVLLRLDVSKQYEDAFKEHPDWFCYNVKGEPVKVGDLYTTCLHGAYWQEYNFKIVEELLTKYDVDGFFYNAFHYIDVYKNEHCVCEKCQQAFKNAANMKLPEQENWESPEWRAYVHFQYNELSSYAKRLQAFIKKIKPDAILTIDYLLTSDHPEHLRKAGWFAPQMAEAVDVLAPEAFDNVTRPYPKWLYWGGEEAKMSLTMGKNAFIIMSYFNVFGSRRSGHPAPQMAFNIMQMAANGGNPCIAPSGTFDQHDREAIPSIKSTYNFLKDNQQFYEKMSIVCDTAIFYSQKTMDFYGKGNSRDRALFEYRGFYDAMIHNHIQFDILRDGAFDAIKLKKYKNIILPNVACLSEEETRIIDDFVHNGGNLIASFDTALFDEEGRPLNNYGLSCMNFNVVERKSISTSYLTINDKSFFKSFSEVDLLPLNGDFISVQPGNSKDIIYTDLVYIPTIKNNIPEFSYWEDTGKEAGLNIVRYGKGKVVYLTWPIGKQLHLYNVPEYKQCISDLFGYLSGNDQVATNAPSTVEVILSKGEGGFVVHLLNSTGYYNKSYAEVIPVHDVTVKVKVDGSQAYSLVTGQNFVTDREGEYIKFTVPSINVFDVVAFR